MSGTPDGSTPCDEGTVRLLIISLVSVLFPSRTNFSYFSLDNRVSGTLGGRVVLDSLLMKTFGQVNILLLEFAGD